MDMWTTQERCPHAHSLNNNKYKSQTKVESAKDYIAHRFSGGSIKRKQRARRHDKAPTREGIDSTFKPPKHESLGLSCA